MSAVKHEAVTSRAHLGLPTIVRPRNNIEKRVAAAFAEALAIDNVSVHDSFFELGGDSLRGAQLIDNLRVLGMAVTARQLFRNPTVARLSTLGDDAGATDGVTEPALDNRQDTGNGTPLSVQQQAIWFLEKLAPGSVGYNALAQTVIRGPLDEDRLRAALDALSARHPAVRTRYPTDEDGLPVQHVLSQAGADLEVVAASGPVGEPARIAGAHVFDLANEAPVRWMLVRRGSDDHVLLQAEHHFAHDGWSMWVLLQDLARAYSQLGDGVAVKLGEDGTSYTAYCRWQQEWLRSPQADRQLQHWIREIGPPGPPLRWPNEAGQRPERFTYQGDTWTMPLDEATRSRVQRFASANQATPFAVLMAAYVVLIGQECQSLAPVLGTMLRNRRMSGLHRTVGMFVNTVALSFPGWRQQGLAVLAGEVTRRLADGLDHQEIPFPVVARELRAPRDPSRNPVFQTCFSMNDWPDPMLDLGEGIYTAVTFPSTGGAKFDLDVVVVPGDGTYSLLWRYNTPLFDRAEVIRLGHRYQELLDHALRDLCEETLCP